MGNGMVNSIALYSIVIFSIIEAPSKKNASLLGTTNRGNDYLFFANHVEQHEISSEGFGSHQWHSKFLSVNKTP